MPVLWTLQGLVFAAILLHVTCQQENSKSEEDFESQTSRAVARSASLPNCINLHRVFHRVFHCVSHAVQCVFLKNGVALCGIVESSGCLGANPKDPKVKIQAFRCFQPVSGLLSEWRTSCAN